MRQPAPAAPVNHQPQEAVLSRRRPEIFRPAFFPLLFAAAFVLAAVLPARGAENPVKVSDAPVSFQAKQLSHDDAKQTVTAIGDVQLEQGKKILRADKMVYYLATDTVDAIGNVSLLDDKGDVHFAEYVELSKDLKKGFIHGLLSLLNDGSRFTAAEAYRDKGVTTMRDATYTPCKVCETDPKPLWQLKADKIVHDEKAKTVHYDNARLEFLGVPLLYTPVFSHADPTVKRKSGFLRPSYGYSSDVGTYVEGGYYFGDIAPDKDATLIVRPTSLKGTLLEGEWRERFKNGSMKINLAGAKSDVKKEDGTVEPGRERGDINATGLFDLSNTWRAGFDVQRASDKEFLRLYDLPGQQNVLQSDAYAERFSGRNYARVAATNFQDVRLGTHPGQPSILPEIEDSMTGEPDGMLGGRWTAGFSTLGLYRSSSGEDMQRASVDAGWERRNISPLGFSTRVSLDTRGDFYAVQDSDISKTDPTQSPSSQTFRGTAVAGMTTSYPMVRRFDGSQVVVEPLVGASFSPRINNSPLDIPNEDSIDLQLDTNNLFAENRFPGIDRQEDGARVNYGLKTGLYGDNGRYARAFIGQSYRFSDRTIFPQGSGLENKASDVVGQFNVSLSRYLSGDYRFQMDSHNLSLQRHEFQANAGNATVDASAKYIYIAPTAGTGFTQSRQQALVSGSYKFAHDWWADSEVLADMGEQPGLRRAMVGLNYADECFSFSVEGVRNLINPASGENGTVLMVRLGFKNIGEFNTPHIQLSKAPDTVPAPP
ncbi:MAG: LPS assembly protein LptD [Alphaproteobacteria bacterium]|nr:LPS assembly protein LptD [Alphaproteobacteria bacterium]